MFGGPSHRLQAQIQATARVLDLEISCMYLPDVVLISFDDAGTGTSSVKFIRQGSALDLGKLHDSYGLYWRVGFYFFGICQWFNLVAIRLFMMSCRSRRRRSSWIR